METNGNIGRVACSPTASNRSDPCRAASESSDLCRTVLDGQNHEDLKGQRPTVLEAKDTAAERYGCEFGVVHRLPCTAVPLLFREAHVRGGFRPLQRPWWYYLTTVLHLHNESVNIWTHVLALVLMVAKLVKFSFTLDFLFDPHTWPLLAGLFCGMSLFAGSATAHCMQSKSELYHYTVFMVDYAGIGLYGLGSVIVHLQYCSEDVFFEAVHAWFVPAGCVLAFTICFCCSMAKVIYKRPYPFRRKFWQIGPVLGIYVLLISPIVHHIVTYYYSAHAYSPGIAYHNLQIFWFFLSGLFYASDIPQRLFPGKCDYFFHSHQLFHVAIMLCILYQMEGVFVDFLSRRHLLVERRPTPTLFSAFAPVALTIAAEAVSILGFRVYVRRNLLSTSDEKRK